jgi:hypothetical protein
VRIATYFMIGGAAVSLVNGVLVVLTVASYRTAIHHAYPHYTAQQVRAAAAAGVTISVVLAVVEIGLWLGLAWACRTGQNWSRVAGTVLFALNTLLLVVPLVTRGGSGLFAHATIGTLLTAAVWLAGLGAVIMLWQRESSTYFTG